MSHRCDFKENVMKMQPIGRHMKHPAPNKKNKNENQKKKGEMTGAKINANPSEEKKKSVLHLDSLNGIRNNINHEET